MQVDLKEKTDKRLTADPVIGIEPPAEKTEQKQLRNANKRKHQSHANKNKYLSPQDTQFLNQLSYLSQLSHFNLTEMESIELCRDNQHTMKKLTNKKTIKL